MEDYQYYTFTDPETGNTRKLLGYQIKHRYIDPMIEDVEDNRQDLLKERSRFQRTPKYRKVTRTSEGYIIYDDPDAYQQYQQKQWDKLSLGHKIERVAEGSILYFPKLAIDTFVGMVRDTFGRDIRKSYTLEALTQSFQEGKQWESQLWTAKKQNDRTQTFIIRATSPLAVTLYTYGAFNLGGRFLRLIAPTGKKVFSRFVPKSVTKLMGSRADVRLAKQSWYQLQLKGTPTYLSGRGELLYGGKVINRFAPRPSIWGGYGTSYGYYNTRMLSEISKVNQFPYERFPRRPRFIETGRTVLVSGDDVTYISKGYTKSFFKPKLDSKFSTTPFKKSNLDNVKKIYIDDKVIVAEMKTSPLKFKSPISSEKTIFDRNLSGAAQLSKMDVKTKSITQFEWYQTPLRQYTSKVSLGSLKMPDTFSMAYGRISLSTLDFLESGIAVSSSRWIGVAPSMVQSPSLGSKNISISESSLGVLPANMLSLGLSPVSLSLQQSRLQSRQSLINKQLQISLPQVSPPTLPKIPMRTPEIFQSTPKTPKYPRFDDDSGMVKKFSKLMEEGGEIGYRIKKWKFPKMEDFLK